jgi:hypothetical protein
MITIFAIPKSFRGHTAVIQRNAIQSWLKLRPKCEIILFGDDEGVAEVAEELDLIHVPHITKTKYGTPLLDFVFRQAQELASNDLLCYVNSDIIFLNDFLPALKEVDFPRFLVSGQRLDLDLENAWDYESADWERRLRNLLAQKGRLHHPSGIDYFVFTKGTFGEMPPFAVGREGWDNWFIYNARAMGVPVIDATQRIIAVHQNHDYNHVPKKSGSSWEGPESDQNLALVQRRIYQWSLEDSNWTLCDRGLVKKSLGLRELFRRSTLAIPPVIHPFLEEIFVFQHNLRYGVKLRKL